MAYFPNGCSCEVLVQQCADCPLGYGWNDPRQGRLFDDEKQGKPCPVMFVQLNYNYAQLDEKNKQLREAMTMLVDDAGICQVRALLVQCRAEASASQSVVSG